MNYFFTKAVITNETNTGIVSDVSLRLKIHRFCRSLSGPRIVLKIRSKYYICELEITIAWCINSVPFRQVVINIAQHVMCDRARGS